MAEPISSRGLLMQRGHTYGMFVKTAKISQELEKVITQALVAAPGKLADDQREALAMVCLKIARILNGDPNHIDNWADIAGYAQLVVGRLEGNPQ